MKLEPPAGTLVPGLHEWSRFHYDVLEALNWSTLKPYTGNLSRARYYEENPPDSSADHFRLGEAVHCCVLEPVRFSRDYIAKPASWPHGGGHLKKTDSTTTEDGALNREFKAKWDKDAQGKEVLSRDEAVMCEGIRKRLQAHRIIGSIVKHMVGNVRNELTCISKLDHDLWTKSLIDIEISVDDDEAQMLFDPDRRFPGQWPGGVYLADLKTSQPDVGPGVKANTWGYTCAKYKYHGQAAFYTDNYERATGIKPAGFFFIPVEKTEPYEPAIYGVLPEQLEAGRKLYTRCIEQREACIMRGKFPGYTDDCVLPMSCADWGLRP